MPPNSDAPIPETFHQLIRKQYKPEPESAWVIWPDYSNRKMSRYLVRPETSNSLPFWLRVETLELKTASANTGATTWLVQLSNVTAEMALAQDKWHFHAMVSHKFRTPLIPLVTGIDLLRQLYDSLAEEEKMAILDQAHIGILRLQTTVNDILEYLNSSSQMRSEPFYLSQLPAIVEALAIDLSLTNVTTVIDPALKNSATKLPLSEGSASLVLREVLDNAKKFHPNNSPEIKIEVVPSPMNNAVHLKVTDNGIHLSSEQIAQVWTPYYQGEKYFTGESGGMGLGLAMVASAVWGVGGSCRMHNRASEPGIVVEIILPVHRALHRINGRVEQQPAEQPELA
jgi:K+-sensing histidine kinase KdpD